MLISAIALFFFLHYRETPYLVSDTQHSLANRLELSRYFLVKAKLCEAKTLESEEH
jgi:hypothetical protein